MSNEKNVLFTIFGGTGDLAQRKLYPSLFRLYKKGNLGKHFAVIGTARRPWSDEHYREVVISTIQSLNPSDEEAKELRVISTTNLTMSLIQLIMQH